MTAEESLATRCSRQDRLQEALHRHVAEMWRVVRSPGRRRLRQCAQIDSILVAGTIVAKPSLISYQIFLLGLARCGNQDAGGAQLREFHERGVARSNHCQPAAVQRLLLLCSVEVARHFPVTHPPTLFGARPAKRHHAPNLEAVELTNNRSLEDRPLRFRSRDRNEHVEIFRAFLPFHAGEQPQVAHSPCIVEKQMMRKVA